MSLYKGNKRVTLATNTPSNVVPLEVTKDGTYTAPAGVNGFNPVTVKACNPFCVTGNHTDADGIWHKPEDWDDIESIDLTNKQEVYILYACHLTGKDWCRIQISGTGTLSWSYGHVTNGIYTMHQDSSEITVSSGGYAALYLENLQDDYIVIRIKTTGNLYYCKFADWAATSDMNYTMPKQNQPALMRYGRLPYGKDLRQSSTLTIESDNILDFAKEYWNDTSTTIYVSDMHSGSTSLQRWRCTGWGLAKNNITSFGNMFYNDRCLSDVPNPLDLRGWVTSNTTTIANMFYTCYALNTRILVHNWDLSNVTSMSSVFYNCYSNKFIEGTETWSAAPKCTTAAGIFNLNYCLLSPIDLSNLYLGNGTANLTDTNSMFSSCYSCPSINISNMNLSKCTNVSYMLFNLKACKKVIMNNVTPISNVCTNGSYIFGLSSFAGELIIDGWDFSGCRANFLIQGGYQNYALQKLVFRNCTAPSGVSINDSTACCNIRYSYNLKYLDVSFVDMSVFTNTTTHIQSFRDLNSLIDFYPPRNISKSFQLSGDNNLSHDSLIRVINNLITLPSGTTATLTIGTYNLNKLSNEEKAVATGKGWTLA